MSSEILWTNTHRNFTALTSVSKTSLFFKYYNFSSWSILSELKCCVRYPFLTDKVRSICFLSLFPYSCNIGAHSRDDATEKMSFLAAQLLVLPRSILQEKAEYCAQRDASSFDLYPLLYSSTAEGSRVSEFFL